MEYSCQEILLNVDYSWKVIRPYSTIVAIIFRRFVIHQIAPGWTPAIRSPMGFSRTTKFIIFPLFVPSPEAKFLRITKHSMSSAIIDSHLRRNTRLIRGEQTNMRDQHYHAGDASPAFSLRWAWRGWPSTDVFPIHLRSIGSS